MGRGNKKRRGKNKMYLEYEDDNGDPWGYSYVGRRSKIFSDHYDEESHHFDKSNKNDDSQQTKKTECEDDMLEADQLVEDDMLEADQLVEDEQERSRISGIIYYSSIFCICVCVGLGVGICIIFGYKELNKNNPYFAATQTMTQPPNAATTMTHPPSSAPSMFPFRDEGASLFNTTCYICGSEEDTISNPDVVPSLQGFLDYPESTTCSDLDYIGQFGGIITPNECAFIQSQTQILKQCGCSSSSTQMDVTNDEESFVEEETPKRSFPSCYLCGSESMNNPLANVTIFFSWGYMETVTCQDVNAIGITGYLSQQECSAFQSNREMIETCGCGKNVSKDIHEAQERYSLKNLEEAPLNTTSLRESETLSFPQCLLCGSETDGFSNPDSIASLPTLLGYPIDITCAELNSIGKKGSITPESCAVIQSQIKIVKQCGCSNFLAV